jgi:hypothetical protein
LEARPPGAARDWAPGDRFSGPLRLGPSGRVSGRRYRRPTLIGLRPGPLAGHCPADALAPTFADQSPRGLRRCQPRSLGPWPPAWFRRPWAPPLWRDKAMKVGLQALPPALAPAVAGMRLAPRLDAGDRGRSPVVVAILQLGQPLGRAVALAGRPIGGLPAIALVAGIARVGREALPAARTGPPSFLPHVASPARSAIWLEDTPRRTPKKTPPEKKTPGRDRSEEEEDGQEGPVSPRQI